MKIATPFHRIKLENAVARVSCHEELSDQLTGYTFFFVLQPQTQSNSCAKNSVQ